MSLSTTRDQYDEIEGNQIFNYVLLFFAALLISGFLTLAAIRLFQSDAPQSRQLSPLVRVPTFARVSPLEVAIVEAAARPFATDPVTPYQEQLRETGVLDSQVTASVSGNSKKTDSSKDSTPVEISKPETKLSVAEPQVRKIRTVHRAVHPISNTVKRNSPDNSVLLARVETPVASQVQSKAVQAAPITEPAALKPMENISAASALQAQVNTGTAAASKPVENISVASIAPSPVNTVSSVTNKPTAEMAPVENKNSVTDSSSIHSPLVSPYTSDSEVKVASADTLRDTAAAGVPKEENGGTEDKKKGISFGTVIDWTIRIVGFALLFLK